MAFRPTARHVCEHGQNRQFIVVVPKQEGIVPEKNEAKEDDKQAGRSSAKNFRTRGARLGHLRQQTPNAQRPTPNSKFRRSDSSFCVPFCRPNACRENSD